MINIKNFLNSPRVKTTITVIAVLLLTAIAFYPCLKNDFTNWDEEDYLLRNPNVRDLSFKNIQRIFSTAILSHYSPLTVLSFAIEYKFFQYNPRIYHAVNLAFHLGVVLLIFLFARQCGLTSRGAFLSSLLFGIHPIHVESVAWIVERKDVLYAFFYLSALCCYLAYLHHAKEKFYGWAILLGLLSMLAKAMALSLPLILWVCDWIQGKRNFRTAVLNKIPFFLYIIPIAWITYSLNARIPEESLGQGLLIWIWTFIFYIKKFFAPISLIPIYPLPQPVTLLNPIYSGDVLLFIGILTLLFISRNRKWLIFSFLYYFLSIFFCLRFDHKVYFDIVADRFMYLPSLGFCIALGVLGDEALTKLKKQSPVAQAGLKLLILGLCLGLVFKTHQQCSVWKNSISLWEYVIQRNPHETRAYNNLATDYIKRKEYDAALALLQKALTLKRNNAEAYTNIGLAYLGKGDNTKAIENFTIALKIRPDYAPIYNNFGVALKNTDNSAGAKAALEKAIALDPRLLEPRYVLAKIYLNKKMVVAAEQLYLECLEIDPNNAESLINLITLYFETNQPDQASRLSIDTIRKTADTKLLTRLAETFLLHKHSKLAMACYHKVIQKDPQNRHAFLELGKIYGNYNQFDQAIAVWQQGARLNRNDKRFSELIRQAESLKAQLLTKKKNDSP